VRTPDRYIDAIESRTSPVAGEETLDETGRQLEGLQLALRTRVGVPLDALDVDDDIADLVHVGAGRITLTKRGRFLANEIALRLHAS
jgi:coproporphyrinogen III oxidase-like Fe-S oxidoreductase